LIKRHPVRIVESEVLPKLARLFTMESGVGKILLGEQGCGGKPERQARSENCEKKGACALIVADWH
jgi:hypothetical protein